MAATLTSKVYRVADALSRHHAWPGNAMTSLRGEESNPYSRDQNPPSYLLNDPGWSCGNGSAGSTGTTGSVADLMGSLIKKRRKRMRKKKHKKMLRRTRHQRRK